MTPRPLTTFVLTVAALGLTAPASTLEILLDYRHDDFFTTTPTARAAIEAAAADFSAAITTSLSPIDSRDYPADQAGVTLSLQPQHRYVNPATPLVPGPAPGFFSTLETETLEADILRVFVAGTVISRSALDPALAVAFGSEIQVRIPQIRRIGGASEQDARDAIDTAVAAAQPSFRRGGGPIIRTESESFRVGISPEEHPIEFDGGPAYSSVMFDIDRNNDAVRDEPSEIAARWHYDHTTPVAPGKIDLYTVALHEFIHALGAGSSRSWDQTRSGADWSGRYATAAALGGDGLLYVNPNDPEEGFSHLGVGQDSFRLADGQPQGVLLQPSISSGVRRRLTSLDLALLRDIGWDTVDYQARPSDFNVDGLINDSDLARWRIDYGLQGPTLSADANADSLVGPADYTIWRDAYSRIPPESRSLVAPEPTGAGLLLLTACSMLRRHR